jgi:hypothetical protein
VAPYNECMAKYQVRGGADDLMPPTMLKQLTFFTTGQGVHHVLCCYNCMILYHRV